MTAEPFEAASVSVSESCRWDLSGTGNLIAAAGNLRCPTGVCLTLTV